MNTSYDSGTLTLLLYGVFLVLWGGVYVLSLFFPADRTRYLFLPLGRRGQTTRGRICLSCIIVVACCCCTLRGMYLVHEGRDVPGGLLQSVAALPGAWWILSLLRSLRGQHLLRTCLSLMAGVMMTRVIWLLLLVRGITV